MNQEHVAVVDGSNVAYAELSQQGEPKVSNLVAIGRALEAHGYRPIVKGTPETITLPRPGGPRASQVPALPRIRER